jgi:hypothetical protein
MRAFRDDLFSTEQLVVLRTSQEEFMKRRIAFTTLLILSITIVIAVGTAIKAHAQRQHFCSNATLRGDYAIRATGSVVSGQVFAPVAFVGLFRYDGKGQLAGNLTVRLTDLVNGPATSSSAYLGTYQVNADCTFQEEIVNQANGGSNIHSATINDNGAGFFFLVTTTGPTVVSGDGRKVSLRDGERD